MRKQHQADVAEYGRRLAKKKKMKENALKICVYGRKLKKVLLLVIVALYVFHKLCYDGDVV